MKRLGFLTLIVLIGCNTPESNQVKGSVFEFSVKEDQELPFDHYDVKGRDIEVIITQAPLHGNLRECENRTQNSLSCIYKPHKDFYGHDYMKLKKVSSSGKIIALETIHFNITPVGDIPKASDLQIQAQVNQKRIFYAPLGIDKDSIQEDLEYKMVRAPNNGVVDDECFLGLNNKSNRECTYQPDEGFSGNDEIQYQIVDETKNISRIATVKIKVSPKRGIAGEQIEK